MDPCALLRDLNASTFTTGRQLAARHGVSPATVSSALQRAVADYGVELHRLRGQGYRLARAVDWWSPERLQQLRRQLAWPADIQLLPHTDSTNSQLLAAARSGAASGTVLLAEWQDGGRGRMGRRWQAPLGSGLTFSLLWRSRRGAADLAGLSLAIGWALADALRRLGFPLALKWPNDLLGGGGKLGGILIEVQGDMLGPSAVVIGVGLNVQLSAAQKQQVDQAVAALADFQPVADRHALLACVLPALAAALQRFDDGGFASFADDWSQLHHLHQQAACLLQTGAAPVHGVVQGIDGDGALRFLCDDGRLLRVCSGEISLRTAAPRKE